MLPYIDPARCRFQLKSVLRTSEERIPSQGARFMLLHMTDDDDPEAEGQGSLEPNDIIRSLSLFEDKEGEVRGGYHYDTKVNINGNYCY